MKYSENYNLALPSREENDIADINEISNNFKSLDSIISTLDKKADTFTYITMQGTSGIWSYRVWSDNSVECWGRKACENVYCTNAWGSVFESTTSYSAEYPFLFDEIPYQTLSISGTSDYAVWLEYPTDTASNSKTGTGSWYFVRPTAMEIPPNTVYVDIYVKGKLPPTVLKNESFDGRNVFQFSGSYPEFTYGGDYAVDYYNGEYGYLVKNAVVRDINLVSVPWDKGSVRPGLRLTFYHPGFTSDVVLAVRNLDGDIIDVGLILQQPGESYTNIGTENDKLTIYRLS